MAAAFPANPLYNDCTVASVEEAHERDVAEACLHAQAPEIRKGLERWLCGKGLVVQARGC